MQLQVLNNQTSATIVHLHPDYFTASTTYSYMYTYTQAHINCVTRSFASLVATLQANITLRSV